MHNIMVHFPRQSTVNSLVSTKLFRIYFGLSMWPRVIQGSSQAHVRQQAGNPAGHHSEGVTPAQYDKEPKSYIM